MQKPTECSETWLAEHAGHCTDRFSRSHHQVAITACSQWGRPLFFDMSFFRHVISFRRNCKGTEDAFLTETRMAQSHAVLQVTEEIMTCCCMPRYELPCVVASRIGPFPTDRSEASGNNSVCQVQNLDGLQLPFPGSSASFRGFSGHGPVYCPLKFFRAQGQRPLPHHGFSAHPPVLVISVPHPHRRRLPFPISPNPGWSWASLWPLSTHTPR